MTNILSIKNLSLIRQRPLLQNINWTIEPEQHWCILGANGSGKTLLLKTLLAYEAKTTGEVQILGKTYGYHDWRELRKKIGWISNDIARKIAPNTTGLQVILSGINAGIGYASDYQQSDIDQAKKILEQIEFENGRENRHSSMERRSLINQTWKFCSQGERQRLLISRALLSNFKILILDEPCSGLDPASRMDFLALLQTLIQNKKLPTLILVTHHVEEILPEISHVLMIKNGQILSQGKKSVCLNSHNLTNAFNRSVQIEMVNKQYHLSL